MDAIPRAKKESDESHNAKRHKLLVDLLTSKEVKKDDKKSFAVPVAKRWKGGKSG